MKIINICGEYYWITPLGEKLYPNLGIEINYQIILWRKKMFGTEEQQKKMLEAIQRRNESIELLSQSFGKGMKKLDDHADDLLKNLKEIKKEYHKLINFPVLLKQICDEKLRKK